MKSGLDLLMKCAADVAMITPLCDGMNLVSKEYVASKADSPGVLILSEMAGSAKELGEAVIVNPNYPEEICDAIAKALEMPREEQLQRLSLMQRRLRSYDIVKWGNDFMRGMELVREKQEVFNAKLLGKKTEEQIIAEYRKAGKALIMLDYDGTLVQFADDARKAAPTQHVLSLLKSIAAGGNNEVVITSGRDRSTLDRWFGALDLSLVAEHGVLIKDRGEEWRFLRPLTSDWKPGIIPILRDYADRLPGSQIEEKEFSVVWHYRKAETDFAKLRIAELFDNLSRLTANADIQVYRGNKIIEIKNSGVNKGSAAAHFISRSSPDFILAMGDDYTDEDMFRSLPKEAYSIRVGMAQSNARFNLRSTEEALKLLEKLAKPGGREHSPPPIQPCA